MGELVLVRSIPRWGLSSACESIADGLGESAVVVDGRAFTEKNQKALREEIDSGVAAAIEKTGCAQLIFDNYGHAIRRSQGGTLHSMLYRLLVDSEGARDTGALLVARPADMLDLRFSGSPLISRTQTVVLPAVTAQDADALGVDFADLTRHAGESTWLARRFINVTARQGTVSAVEHLNNDRRRIVASLPPAAIEVLAGARAAADANAMSREALMCLGSFDANDSFEPSELVRQSQVLAEVQQRNPGWPNRFDDSVRRFALSLAGVQSAIWVDRYLFHAGPSQVRAFLDALRGHTETGLRLLVSEDRTQSGFSREISSALQGLDGVQVRFMNRHDWHQLHDRHLVLPAFQSGYVLPTARVIVGMDDPGSAVSVPMPALAVDYAAFWDRGVPVYP